MSAFTVDKAFEGAGAQTGLELWRVEAKQVVKQTEVTANLAVALAVLSTVRKRLRLPILAQFCIYSHIFMNSPSIFYTYRASTLLYATCSAMASSM
jgi:hypothetical protein